LVAAVTTKIHPERHSFAIGKSLRFPSYAIALLLKPSQSRVKEEAKDSVM
jgi:hypothetical protein